ncbi:MAG TPA: SRPBCC domain-containing protein [Acidimicrobiales bacterium]
MIDIRHRIGIEAPQAQVHQALATREGVASWWSRDAEGDAGEGGKLVFRFGRPEARLELEVVDVTPDRVQWRCLYGPDEWLDTTITFELDEEDGETAVLFTHGGWREAVPFEAHCSTKWAYFLIGLKLLLEGGETSAAPGDLHISRWG